MKRPVLHMYFSRDGQARPLNDRTKAAAIQNSDENHSSLIRTDILNIVALHLRRFLMKMEVLERVLTY